MRILLISSKLPPEYSGSGNRIFETYQDIKKTLNLDVEYLCSSTLENSQKIYIYRGQKIKMISKKILNLSLKKNLLANLKNLISHRVNYFVEFILTFIFLIKCKNKYDIFHIVGNNHITSSAITFSKIFKIPILVEVVNDVDTPKYYEPFFFNIFFQKGYPRNSKIIVISKKLYLAMIKSGYKKSQLWHKPNTVKDIFFTFNKKRINKKRIEILHLAKFIPRKKHDFLLNVLNKLPKNYFLTLAGPLEKKGFNRARDNEYFFKIKQKIKQLKLEKRVKLIAKFVTDPHKLIDKCNIFVLPSVNEGLGTPLLEAIAMRKPVVSNNLKNIFDVYVKDSSNGFVCDLNENLWAKRIIDCKKIKYKNLIKHSNRIKNIANNKIINQNYLKILKQLEKQKK